METGAGDPLEKIGIVRYHAGDGYPAEDVAAREEPLEVRLNGGTLAFLMRLPGDDLLLAAGFCLSEGLITDRGQITMLAHCREADGPAAEGSAGPGNLVQITADLPSGTERFQSGRVVRTGCGGADLERELDLDGIRVESRAEFSPGIISALPDRLLEGQEIFRLTGGTHGAGLFDTAGGIIVVKEDVGRHNAVDKVLGHMLLSREEPSDKGLVLSGRLSYEMVLKAARAGIPLVCSVSAPTALGIHVAEVTGVTLVGFLRGQSFNVYSHPGRIGGG